MSSDDVNIPRWRAIAALVAIAGSLLWGALVLVGRGDAALEEAALDQAAALIENSAERGVVVVHPPWRDDVAAGLRARLPSRDIRVTSPVHHGRPRAPIALLRVGSSPGPAGFGALRLAARESSGALTLERYQGVALAADAVDVAAAGGSLLLDDVAALAVRVVLAEREVVCDDLDPAGPRYRCPSLPDWNNVGTRTLVIAGKERRCLWAHPITGGKLVIEAPWPTGVERVEVFHGLADSAASAPGGQPVTLELKAGERSLARLQQENQRGWNKRTVELGAAAERLTFEVTTAHDGARHFCIDARPEEQ